MSRPTEERTLPATVHGTYLLRRPEGEPAGLLIGCHGYGETAADHLQELTRIRGSERWLLCAVQALHPFYKRSGAVVASWMTKHDREQAIADNTAYLDSVLDTVHSEHPEAAARVAYVGFSQGVAMAYRAAASTAARAAKPGSDLARASAVIALAGDVPPDVLACEPLRLPPVLISAGRDDTWYGLAKMEDEVARLRQRGVEAEGFAFEGGHEWTEAVYERVGAFLSEGD